MHLPHAQEFYQVLNAPPPLYVITQATGLPAFKEPERIIIRHRKELHHQKCGSE